MSRGLPIVLGFFALLTWRPAAAADVVISARNGTDVAEHMESIGFGDIREHPELLQAVPRFWVPKVPETEVADWSRDVQLRKSVFIRLGISAALQANAKILADRERMLAIDLDDMPSQDRAWLERLKKRYKVPGPVTRGAVAELKLRVDAVPVSLAVTQAAIESGWLQSRFARQGQAVFGQWTTSETGIKALENDVRLAAFDNPHDSLDAYMLNLNTHGSYKPFRLARAEMRAEGKPVDGYALAVHMEPYAQTGEHYVEQIQGIIMREGLRAADTAVLVDGPRYVYIHQPEEEPQTQIARKPDKAPAQAETSQHPQAVEQPLPLPPQIYRRPQAGWGEQPKRQWWPPVQQWGQTAPNPSAPNAQAWPGRMPQFYSGWR